MHIYILQVDIFMSKHLCIQSLFRNIFKPSPTIQFVRVSYLATVTYLIWEFWTKTCEYLSVYQVFKNDWDSLCISRKLLFNEIKFQICFDEHQLASEVIELVWTNRNAALWTEYRQERFLTIWLLPFVYGVSRAETSQLYIFGYIYIFGY